MKWHPKKVYNIKREQIALYSCGNAIDVVPLLQSVMLQSMVMFSQEQKSITNIMISGMMS